MSILRMPQAAKTMDEGTVSRWLKAEGQAISKGQAILEIETSDAILVLESAGDCTLLKVLAPEGTPLPVNAPIAILGTPGEDISQTLARIEAEAPARPAVLSVPAAAPQVAAPTAPAAAPKPAAPAPPRPIGNVVPILMPQAGQSMEEGTMIAWRVKVGDRVRIGDIIFEVETDKATIEVEAVDVGRLARILAQEGDVVPVKQPVALLAENDADAEAYLASGGAAPAAAAPAPAAPAPHAAARSEAPAAPAGETAVTETGRVRASPAARKLADEKGIDLATVGAGSGPGGRVLSTDVATDKPGAARKDGGLRRKMTSMRKAIAKALQHSKQTIPHFYLRLTIDAGPLFDTYQKVKAAAEFKCTINDFVVAACARALAEFPGFRSRIEGDEIVELPNVNVGLAVGTDDGLLVPVVLNADKLGFRRLAGETRRVVEAARAGKLEGVGAGVFTITNLGMFGIEEFHAIINPPEAAILAVGAIREDAIVRDGQVRASKVMTLVLSADHRIVDGVLAAKFAGRLKEMLESPQPLLEGPPAGPPPAR